MMTFRMLLMTVVITASWCGAAKAQDEPAESTTSDPTPADEPKPFHYEGPLSIHAQSADVLGEGWQVRDSLFIDDPAHPPRDERGQLTRRAVRTADAMTAQKLRSLAFVSYTPVEDKGFSPHIVGIQMIVYESLEGCEAAWLKRWEKVGKGDEPLAVAIEGVGDAAWRYIDRKLPKIAVRVGNVWFETDASRPGEEHAKLMIAYLKSLGCPTPSVELLQPAEDKPEPGG